MFKCEITREEIRFDDEEHVVSFGDTDVRINSEERYRAQKRVLEGLLIEHEFNNM